MGLKKNWNKPFLLINYSSFFCWGRETCHLYILSYRYSIPIVYYYYYYYYLSQGKRSCDRRHLPFTKITKEILNGFNEIIGYVDNGGMMFGFRRDADLWSSKVALKAKGLQGFRAIRILYHWKVNEDQNDLSWKQVRETGSLSWWRMGLSTLYW